MLQPPTFTDMAKTLNCTIVNAYKAHEIVNVIWFRLSSKTGTMDPEEWKILITKLFDTLDILDDRDRLKLAIHYLTTLLMDGGWKRPHSDLHALSPWMTLFGSSTRSSCGSTRRKS